MHPSFAIAARRRSFVGLEQALVGKEDFEEVMTAYSELLSVFDLCGTHAET